MNGEYRTRKRQLQEEKELDQRTEEIRKMIEIDLENEDEEQESEENVANRNMNFNWNVTRFSAEEVYIQCYFEEPIYVSSNAEPDTIVIRFIDTSLLFDFAG